MRERDLVKILAERLRQEGLVDLKMRAGHQRGSDIEGKLPESGRRLFIEAKGERSYPDARAAMGEAILQILHHYDYDVICALAVPYTRAFEKLLRSIMPGLARLGIHGLLVRAPDEVWYVSPTRDFSPERPESLVKRLDQ